MKFPTLVGGVNQASCLCVTCHSLGDEHVVQPHELRVRWIVLLDVPEAEHRLLLDLAQDGEERRLHPVAV